jgi:membrane dipeptidase
VPDDILKAVAQNGGVVMVNYVTSFIHRPSYDWSQRRDAFAESLRERRMDSTAARDSLRAWTAKNPAPRPELSVVADHIEHVRDVAGVDHVGIGSDLDGIEDTPVGLEDVSTYPALIAELLKRGWKPEDLKKLAGLNVLRVMRQVEAAAARLQKERGPNTAQIETLDHWSSKPPWEGPVK